MKEKASLGYVNVPMVFSESCKQQETGRSTLNTSYCFSSHGQFRKPGPGSPFQDKAQHKLSEPVASGGEKWGEGKGEVSPDLALVTKHLACPA